MESRINHVSSDTSLGKKSAHTLLDKGHPSMRRTCFACVQGGGRGGRREPFQPTAREPDSIMRLV